MPPSLLPDLAVVVSCAALVAWVSARLRVPRVLGYLFAGILLGPSGPAASAVRDPGVVAGLSDAGVAVLMFVVGLRFSLAHLRAVLPVAGPAGVFEMLLTMSLGWLAAASLGWPTVGCAAAAAMLGSTSTAMAVENLTEGHRAGAAPPLADPGAALRGRLAVAPLVYGVLLLDDLLMAVVLVALSTLVAAREEGLGGLLGATVRLFGIAAGAIALGRLVLPLLARHATLFLGREALVLTSVGVAFGAAALASAAGFPIVFGAFLGGALVAESGLGPRIERAVGPVRDLLVPLFFVAVGMGVDVPRALRQWEVVAALAGAALVGKMLGGLFGGLAAGVPPRGAALLGLYLLPLGEFSFIVAGLLVSAGVPGPPWPAVAVGISLVTAVVGAVVARRAEGIAGVVEAAFPGPLRTFLQAYGVALGRLWAPRASPVPGRRGLWIWLLGHVVADAAVVVALLWLARPAADWMGVAPLGIPPRTFTWGVALLVALPFAVGLFRTVGAISVLLAETATERPGGASPGPASRALTLAFQLVLTVAVGLLLLLATAPVLPSRGVALALLAGAAFLGFLLARAMVRLHTRVRIAVRHMGDPSPAVRESARDSLAVALREAWEHDVVTAEVALPEGAPAVGRALGDLDLSDAGVTAIALRRDDRDLVPPGPALVLRRGDVLVLLGDREALARATARLLGG